MSEESVLKTPPLPTKPIKLSSEKNILEKDVENDNRKFAIKHGCLFEKFTSPARRSVPDRMMTCPNGLIAFIEYKAPGKRATEKQWLDHCSRRGRGVLVYVVDDAAVGRQLIERLIAIDGSPQKIREWADERVVNRTHYTNKNSVEDYINAKPQ